MRRDVLISLRGLPEAGGAPDAVLTTAGQLYRKNGQYSITYRETDLTGMPGVTTTQKLEPDRVTLQRRGRQNDCMVFRQGEKHYTLGDIDGEPFTVSIAANRVRQNLTDSGGEVDIDYTLQFNDSIARSSRLHVTVGTRAPSVDA